jgi:hypothetical protein
VSANRHGGAADIRKTPRSGQEPQRLLTGGHKGRSTATNSRITDHRLRAAVASAIEAVFDRAVADDASG